MTTAAASDPFESTANPAHYVPRPASERVLGAIELALVQGAGPVALTGPSGLGKTMLLQVLADRLQPTYRVVSLRYPALSAGDLCRWVLNALGEPASLVGDDPEGTLLDCAFRGAASGQEILLLVDDASALPPKSARSLATLVTASGGAVRAVLAAGDDARLGPALAALGAGVREIRFEEPMDPEETAAYVRARVAGGLDAEGRGERFDADTLARMYGATGRNPAGRVHELGSVLWRAEAGADIPAAIETWQREDQDRVDEPADETIEIESVGADVAIDTALDDGVEEPPGMPSLEEPAASIRTAEVAEPGLRTAEVSAPVRSRARGTWVAVLLLALLVISLPYALPRLDTWLAERFPEAGTAGEGVSPVVTAPQEPAGPSVGSTPIVASDPVGTVLDGAAGLAAGESPPAEGTEGLDPEAGGFQADHRGGSRPRAVGAPDCPISAEFGGWAGLDGSRCRDGRGNPRCTVPGFGLASKPSRRDRHDTRFVPGSRTFHPAPPLEAGIGFGAFPGRAPSATAGNAVEELEAGARAAASEKPAIPVVAPVLRVGPADPAVGETPPSQTTETPPTPPRAAPDRAPTPEEPKAADISVRADSSSPKPAVSQEIAAPSAEARPAKAPTADRVPQEATKAAATETVAPPVSKPKPKPKPKPSGVLVTIDAPPGVVIHVDGGVVGVTPLKKLRLSPGLHVFRAEFGDERAVVRAVEISTRPAPVRFE